MTSPTSGRTPTSQVIFVWCDDGWCYDYEYEGYVPGGRSDDFRKIEVSPDWDYDQIDEFVFKLNRGKI
jgi:hypothetical protein